MPFCGPAADNLAGRKIVLGKTSSMCGWICWGRTVEGISNQAAELGVICFAGEPPSVLNRESGMTKGK